MKVSRRTAVAGLASAPTLWGCHGKSRTPADRVREARTTTPASDATVLLRIEGRDTKDGADATLRRIFPHPQLRDFDPFVLLDDFDVRVPAGFPEHPHRGFEAFTYMIEGAFHHKDNLGNDSKIAAGGTQRFNSGRGARHSEMPATGGANRGLQLWVNLQRDKKKMTPEYQGVGADVMPVGEDGVHRIHEVVGPTSPVALHTEVDYLDVTLLRDGEWGTTVPSGRNTLLYAIAGDLKVGDVDVPRGVAVTVSGGDLLVRGAEGGRFAYLSGRPHGEPIIHRGPFVD